MPEDIVSYQRRMSLIAGFETIKDSIDTLSELMGIIFVNGKPMEVSDYDIVREYQEEVNKIIMRYERVHVIGSGNGAKITEVEN